MAAIRVSLFPPNDYYIMVKMAELDIKIAELDRIKTEIQKVRLIHESPYLIIRKNA